jgi:filamentous hemagglutinin
MANWLENNEAKLRERLLIKPKRVEVTAMAQSAPPVKPRSGPALTPSQLRAERQAPRPKEKPASKGRVDSATKRVDNGTGPDSAGGSIRNVNKIGGKQNCANCAIATDATLAGNPASALNGGLTHMSALEAHFGRAFSSLTSASRIEAQMLKAGDGARGVIFGSRGTDPGHFFNVINQNGKIRFFDGQTGGAANLDGFTGFSLLRTN